MRFCDELSPKQQEFLPVHTFPLTSPVEHFERGLADIEVKAVQLFYVSANTIIVVVSNQFPVQYYESLLGIHCHSLSQPLFDRKPFCLEFLFAGYDRDSIATFSALGV